MRTMINMRVIKGENMKAHWTRNRKMIQEAVKLDESPVSLIALELRGRSIGMVFKESMRLATLLIRLATTL